MQNKLSGKARSRAEILAEIAALPPSVQGTISSYRCPRKNGPPAVYHNLQYTRGGKNHSFSIPVDKVSEFRAAVAAKDCEPRESERNARNHPKRIVTLFGELPPIRRTYWYDEDGYEGRYPFDDRLGLVGRYTPAACADTVRSAVDRPFADAARDFSAKHAFRISADTVREIVGPHHDAIRDFPKDESHAKKEDAGGAAPLVCVMADGTGIPLRKECLKGAKGKDGRAKAREAKAAAIFRASTTSDSASSSPARSGR